MNGIGLQTGSSPGADPTVRNDRGYQTKADGYIIGPCLGTPCPDQPVIAIGEVKLTGGRTIYYRSDGQVESQAQNHIDVLNPYHQGLVGQFMTGIIMPTLVIVSTASRVDPAVLKYATDSGVNVFVYHPEQDRNGEWTLVGEALNPVTVATTHGTVYSVPAWLVTNPLYNGLDAFSMKPSCPES